MKKDILITGATGFVGSRINGGTAFTGRIEDRIALMNQTYGINGIVHLAANGNKRSCEENPIDCVNSNLVGLCNVLNVAAYRKIWVLFISTYQVNEPSVYGLSKLLGEEICRKYKSANKARVSILRLPIVYGENDKPDKVVTKFINKIKKGEEPEVLTDKLFTFCYVRDAVRMIENEVNVLEGKARKKYTLRDLIAGIKKCLKK